MTKEQRLDINYHALVDIRRRKEQLRPDEVDDFEIRVQLKKAENNYKNLECVVMREIEFLEEELNINEPEQN